jgi:DNA-binding transcriptional regulator YhcF (GntR family)
MPWKADNSKIKKELGMKFRPMQETMEDAFQALVDEGILKARRGRSEAYLT